MSYIRNAPVRKRRHPRSYVQPYRPVSNSHPGQRRVIRKRQRPTVRTQGWKMIGFLIMLGVLGWYSGIFQMGAQVLASMRPSDSIVAPKTAFVYPGQHSIQGAPTITVAKINALLCGANSPACGDGQDIYTEGVQANINPAYALAFFQHESSFGLAGMATTTHSLGNLRCIANYPCPNGYAAFPDWQSGFQAWYALIDSDVYIGSGLTTIETIIPRYAPPTDNNDDVAYINSVVGAVLSWQG